MTYFVRIEFLAGGFLKTHTVSEFSEGAKAVEFAAAQTGADVVSVKIYTNAH